MRKRELENKKLDEIGKVLVRNGSLRPSEVEKIVVNPVLFDSVKARIASSEEAARSRNGLLLFVRRHTAVFASAVVTVAAVAFTVSIFRQEAPQLTARVPSTPQISQEFRRSDKPDGIATSVPPAVEQIRPVRTSVGPSSTRVNRPKRQTFDNDHNEGEFYAISYAGDPNETDRGARIIRVDMPRSALFAMGVDIPLENEAELIKTDLLVGTDGVTRAIRVVK